MVRLRKIAALSVILLGTLLLNGQAGAEGMAWMQAHSDDDVVYDEEVTNPENREYVPSHETTRENIGQAIVREAKRLIGIRYIFGGTSPSQGFDCSGLVWYSHRLNGIRIPRSADLQMQQARPVSLSRIRPGDLLFFDLGTRKISHVGIYAGNGRFIHAPSSGKRVSYARLDNPYWRKRLIAAGRFHR